MSVYVMPRTRRGVVQPGKFEVKIQFKWPDGSTLRQRFIVGVGTAYPVRTEKQAESFGATKERALWAAGPPTAAMIQEKLRSPETCSDWFDRYYSYAETGEVGRKNQGKPQVSAGDRRDRFRVWLEPLIGTRQMSEVAPEHLRGVVKHLDDQVRLRNRFYEAGETAQKVERGGKKRKPGLSAKTASHIWCEVTSAFKEACSSKIDDLRIITINPALSVQPPIRTKPREQDALYPSEVVQLLSCERIPLARRRLYAAAIYTAARRSELERLSVEDIDFEHQRITVRGSKSDAAYREIPIEVEFLPLLRKIAKEVKAGPLLEVPSGQGSNGTGDLMKLDLKRAKLTRPALYRDDAHVMPFTFHGLRHTAITHWAFAGKSQLFLLTVAGHLDASMTKRYLGKAASVSAMFGDPHPPLPASLFGGAEVIPLVTAAKTA